ncbi:hypothetical protein [Legionella rubrilucens]|uniref:hypothetical protein n=1 Tax=Legionella rubrilucens TaxID=458 RepID=UPI000731C849|nr:hypothetical protein [Legionella rubrilucens]
MLAINALIMVFNLSHCINKMHAWCVRIKKAKKSLLSGGKTKKIHVAFTIKPACVSSALYFSG